MEFVAAARKQNNYRLFSAFENDLLSQEITQSRMPTGELAKSQLQNVVYEKDLNN